MKQENPKNSRKKVWLIVAIIALLAAIGVALALILPGLLQPQEQGNEALVNPQVYFNLDRNQMLDPETTLSTRTPGEDGLYHFRFSVYGEVKEVSVINDKKLVNYMDTLDVLCPVFDENGVITDVQTADQHFLVTNNLFVKRMLNGNLEANSSTAMNGMDAKFPINEASGIYDCQLTAANPGTPSEAEWLDKIIAVTDKEKTYAHIYIVDNEAFEGEVAWRAARKMYADNATTRVPDENGVYTMEFFIDGKLVERKCKNKDKVSQIDKIEQFSCVVALEYDEEGYIIDWFSPSFVLRGFELCKSYTVTAVENGTFSATYLMAGTKQGDTVEATYDDTCKIWNCCRGCKMDQPTCEKTTELKVGDIVSVYTDLDGKPIEIYVGLRQPDSPMYFNVTRKWSTANQATTRVPDEEGYYHIDLAVNGKVKEFKTKNVEHVNYIDSLYYFTVGLKTSGNIIKEVYAGNCVCGYTGAFVNRYVTNTVGTVVSVVLPPDLENGKNWLTSGKCEIYDVSGDYGTTMGQKTSLKVGDKVIGFINTESKLTHVYVVQHYNGDMTTAYNMNRQYDSATKGTARTPDANGYYVFDLAINGAVKQYKTKSKAMADFIDRQSPWVVGVKVSGNIIKDACLARSTALYGTYAYTSMLVDNTKGNILSVYSLNLATRKDNATQYKITSKTKIYNVSGIYDKQPGEKTKLRANDKVCAIVNSATGELTAIYVTARTVNTNDIYWQAARVTGTHLDENGVKVTNRTPNSEGYYVFDLLYNGKRINVKTKDLAMATQIDSYTQGFGLILDGDIVKRVLSFQNTANFNTTLGNFDITKITKDTIYATRMRAAASNFGTEVAAKYNKNTKFINVISSSPDFGKIVTPKIGDRVVGYGGGDGGTNYVFITQESSHKKGAFSYCAHCDKTVFWDIWTSTNIADGMHCYLPNDQATAYTFGVSTDELNCDMVLDLNGCTLTGSGLLVDVYDKLTIVDTVGGGKISGGGNGNIRVNEGATLTVLSGTITGGNTTLTGVGGNIYVNNGTVNVKGGTISNGVSYLGSNIYHTGSKGSVNISGGKVIGGSVYAENSKIISVSGNVEINNLIVKPGNIINVGKLASDASVTVKADGVFTNNGAASYIKNFKVTDAADAIAASGTALKYTNNSGAVVPSKPSVNDPLVLDADGMSMCMVCGEKVKWIPIHDGETIGVMNPAQPGYDAERFPDVDGAKYHFYIADDNMVSGNGDFLYSWNQSTICLHLNGKTANIKGGIYGGNDSGVNIMGEGTLNHLGTATSGVAKRNMFQYFTGALNLYGGIYESNENIFNFGNNSGKIKIADDAVVNETINLNQSKLTIDGGAQIQKINVSGKGKVTINKDFTGSAVIDFAADKVTSGLVSASNGVATGDFAGQVITSEGNVIKNSDGRLAITATKVTPPAFTDEDITVVLPDVFDPANNDGKAFCEACQAIVVWTPFNAGMVDQGTDGHYYVSEGFTHNDTYVMKTSGTFKNICINLNGKTITTNKGFYFGNSSKVNFMGKGEVVYTGTGCLFETYSCTLKFYGGIYTATEANAKIQIGGSTYHTWIYNTPKFNGLMRYIKGSLHLVGSPEIKAVQFGNNANTKLYVEGTFGGKIDSITFDVGLTDNKVPAAFASATAEFTGSITLADGRGLVKDADSNQLVVTVPKDIIDLDTYDEAWCEACNAYIAKADWTAMTAGLADTATNGHYYLADSFTHNDTYVMKTSGTFKNICFNLNGKTLTTNKGFYLGNTSKVNFMGDGEVVYTGTGCLFETYSCTLKFYGGIYTANEENAKIQVGGSTYHTWLYNTPEFNGLMQYNKGSLHLVGSPKIKAVRFGNNANTKLYVEGTFDGKVDSITFDVGLTDNKVPAAFASATAEFPGKIILADGRGLVKDTASTQLIATERQPVEGVFEPWEYNGNAYCPVCKSIQTWTGITAAPGTVAADAHLYLDDNITYSTAGAFFVDVNSGKTLHLNMNGKNITSDVANVPNALGPRVLGTLALLNTSETESTWTAGCASYGEFFLNSANGGFTLYDGVTLRASATNAGQPVVGIMNGTFTMEGGTIDVSGKDNVAAIQVRNTTNTAAFVMNDGEIISGTTGLAVRVGQSVAAGQANYAALNGGKISGNILARAGSVVLDKAGSPEAVSILENAKLVVKETWTGNAVAGFTPAPVNGVVAAANGEATGAFTGGLFLADGNKLVKSANSNQLVVNDVIAAAAAMTFPTDGSSKVMDCPACGAKDATWTAYTGTAPRTASHLYVPADVEYSGKYMVVESGTAKICLHLNGKNITAKADGAYAFYVNKLNIMGNGVVTGNGTAASNAVGTAGAVFHTNMGKGAGLINIYGGTYKKLSTNTTNPILTIGQNGGTVNMYGGIIDASGTTITGMPTAVALQGSATGATSASAPAYFNMYGGEIKGGTTDSFGGAIRVGGISLDGKYADSAHFVMHGGKITGGTAIDGGAIYADKNCGTLTINGGIITGGKAKLSGGNIYVTKGDLTIGAGAIIQNGVAGDPTDSTTSIGGGNIWFGTGTMTTAGKILNGECISVKGAGGNIFLFGSGVVTNFYMTDGEVKGGKLPTGDNQNYGCNIRAYRVKLLSVTGGEISGGIGGYAGADNRRDRGRNLYAGYTTGEATEIILSNCNIDGEVFVNGGTLTLSGDLVIGGTERGLDLDNNITANVTGLTSGASIKLSGLDANTVFSGDCGTDAATLAKRFVMIDNNLTVDVDASNCLYVKTK